MAIIAQIDDADERFLHAKTTSNIVVLNDVSSIDHSEINLFDAVVNTSDKNVLTSAPSCECGNFIGIDRLGDVCPDCQTPVKQSTQIGFTEDVWIRAPGHMTSFISPAFVAALIHTFTKKRVREQCIVSWILNSQARPSKESGEMMRWRDEFGMGRGLQYFIDNFDQCMHTLYAVHNKVYDKTYMQALVNDYRKAIFPRHIPILGKSFVIVEKNATGAYTGSGISLIVDTINLMKGIDADADINRMSEKMIDSRAARALLNLVSYRLDNMRLEMFRKKALVRQHVFGYRSHFTMRCVATSITEPHEYDVVQLPWGPSIGMLRLHITNRLMARGFSPSQINNIINSAIHTYDPIVSECVDELIAMSPEGYFDIILLRNPTLGSGSIQRLKAVVKRDPKDYTISHPIMDVRLLNLDFDGDSLPCTIIVDSVMREATEILKPHYAYLEVSEYGKPSGAFDFPKPTAAIIHNFFRDQSDLGPMGSDTLKLLQAA